MKPLLPLLLSSFLLAGNCGAQNPLVKQWDYRYGGTKGDEFTSFQQTKDGGYILGGGSKSGVDGDKTQVNWDTLGLTFDYWIVKLDSLGIKQWDKRFGGLEDDVLWSLQQTTDGGYILEGDSYSGIGGDKTQALQGVVDFWIVKIDSLGNKQWDKDFGGTSNDYTKFVQQTADSGYILGGMSQSGISGDKTQQSYGSYDFWIVKVDSLGNKQWDKDFGGTNEDELYSLEQTADKGYILGGMSKSGISGDKTQQSYGYYDYWIVKTDSLGNKQWDKDFGGIGNDYLMSLLQSVDSGFILGGFSNSIISGNKSTPLWGYEDYWIIKVDSIGNKEWEKDFGGTSYEASFGNVSQTSDGGYLIAGTSYSPIGGDKTENNLGMNQNWVIKTNATGNKQWDKTIFTNGRDEFGYALQTKDGCYVFANRDSARMGGYKTQDCWGFREDDYWLIKFCDSTLTTNLSPSQLNNPNSEITVSPNPTEGKFIIRLTPAFSQVNPSYGGLSEGEGVVSIFNILGEKVYSQTSTSSVTETSGSVNGRWLSLSKPETQIDISSLPSGIYILQLSSSEKTFRTKVVKE